MERADLVVENASELLTLDGGGPGPALGAAMLVIGVLGFAMGGMHQLFSTEGADLIVFSLNPFHDILHLLSGGLFLWAAVRPTGTIQIGAATGAALLAVLTVAGVLMTNGAIHNYLAANTADNLFHVASGLVAVGAAVLASQWPDRDRT